MFQIMRIEKIKNAGGVTGALMHMKREGGKADNADHARTHLNIDSISSADEGMKIFNEIDSAVNVVATNSVHALDFMITASPDFFINETRETWMKYLNDGLKWVQDLVGKENIVASSIQLDETTPHLSVIAVPVVKTTLKGGHKRTRLSAAKYVDGSAKLAAHQDSFHETVSEKYDLGRGTKGSLASHTEVQEWYGQMREEFSGRMKDLEDENERLREESENHQMLADAKIAGLLTEINNLKEEGGRWRKQATEMSKDVFTKMIEETTKIQPLINLKEAIEMSDALPRGAKGAVLKMLVLRQNEITQPTRITTKTGRHGY